MLFAVFYLLLRRLGALAGAPRIGTTTSRSWSFVISSPYSSAVLAGRALPPRSAVHGRAKQGAPAPADRIVPCQSADSPSVAP